MSAKNQVSKEQNEKHKNILRALLKKEENRNCADCGARGPTWASTNIGVFVCLTCSGIHRSLGVHISVVRSSNLDTWLPEQVAFISRIDNVKANQYWEANLPNNFKRPKDTDQRELERFIRDKYAHQQFRDRDMPPPTIDNFRDHPLTGLDSAPPSAPVRASTGSVAPSAIAAGRGAVAGSPASSSPLGRPEPPVQMMADLLSLDDPAPAPAIPTMNSNGWDVRPASVANAVHISSASPASAPQSSDPFAMAQNLPLSAPAEMASPADPFAVPSSATQPFEDMSAQMAEPAKPKMTNDDILKLFDAAPQTTSFAPPQTPQMPQMQMHPGMQGPNLYTNPQQHQVYGVQVALQQPYAQMAHQHQLLQQQQQQQNPQHFQHQLHPQQQAPYGVHPQLQQMYGQQQHGFVGTQQQGFPSHPQQHPGGYAMPATQVAAPMGMLGAQQQWGGGSFM